MAQYNLVFGQTYRTFKELYDDQNSTTQAKIRGVLADLGYSEASIYRLIRSKKMDTELIDVFYNSMGIARHTKLGYFFEQFVSNFNTGLS